MKTSKLAHTLILILFFVVVRTFTVKSGVLSRIMVKLLIDKKPAPQAYVAAVTEAYKSRRIQSETTSLAKSTLRLRVVVND